MKTKLKSLILTVFITLSSLVAFAQVPPAQRQALIDLYNNTNGANWINKTGWDVNNPNAVVTSWNPVTQTGWYGVTVFNGHVIYLTLTNNNLTGPLNNNLKDLTNLLALSMQGNKLSGSIPLGMYQLQYLQDLNLSGNNLTGGLSSAISGLINVIDIRLSNNINFGGTIPEEIGTLTKINRINLDGCNLSGSIPGSIGQLTGLKSLFMQQNNLSGPLPASIGNLRNLDVIWLQDNKLSGPLPATLSGLKSITVLNLQRNQITGAIPSLVGMEKIISLDLGANQLTGSIPEDLGQLSTMRTLNLGANYLTGTIPPTLGNLGELWGLNLYYNNLEGSIPASFQNLRNLRTLQLTSNKLSGPIPNLTGLEFFSGFSIEENRFRFADFEAQFPQYMQKLSAYTAFMYAPQAKIDVEETITVPVGGTATLSMYNTDPRYTQNESYKWYKRNVGSTTWGLIPNQNNRTYVINGVNAANEGDYYCTSEHPQMTINTTSWLKLILTREIIKLRVSNCAPLTGVIKASQPDKTVPCTNSPVNFTFETSVTPITKHVWTFYGTDGTTVLHTQNTLTTNTIQYTYTAPGVYKVKVDVTDGNGCVTTIVKNITISGCNSCTINNPTSQTVKQLYINLLNHLHVKMVNEGSIPNGYNPPELVSLAPYITDTNPRIYNAQLLDGLFSFSFADHGLGIANADISFRQYNNSLALVADVNLSDFESAAVSKDYLLKYINNETEIKNSIRHINFCPTDGGITCVSHIAIVVDESGSIDETEAMKIRKQLKAFVQQQADYNDSHNANIHVSLIGMSDSDTDLRSAEHIPATRVTNSPAVMGMFNQWINNYRLRSGVGISPSSDYWKSGLTAALDAPVKPNAVIMITDGCQTANLEALINTMKRFKNYRTPGNTGQSLTPNGPQLYVVGIEEGYYVDENTTSPFGNVLPRNQNPNYVPDLMLSRAMDNTYTTAATSLRESLQFLLGYPSNEYPVADLNNFTKDYYGHDSFYILGSDIRYFTNNLVNKNFICGDEIYPDICDDCFSFQPEPGREYVISAWVKEDVKIQQKTYTGPQIKITYYKNKRADDTSDVIVTDTALPSGEIIDGWQRIVKRFKVPYNASIPSQSTVVVGFELFNDSPTKAAFFDDVRIHPLEGSMKAFVYDPETFKLMSELDENNYATFYEYDNEGGLVRIKKETEKGIKTIQETRSGNVIKVN